MENSESTSVNGLCGQKILVTGAAGFLGSHLCDRLVRLRAEVYGISRSSRKDFPNAKGIRWAQGDFADIAVARQVVGSINPDVIFHLAGLVTALPDRDLVLPTIHSLLVSTVNTLIATSETGCRRVLVAASLTEPQGNLADGIPVSPYAAAKWASSVYARMFHRIYETPVVMVRPFMTYGPMQDRRKLVPHAILSLLRGKPPKLSSGEWQSDWIFIDDVIDGFLAAAQAPKVEGFSFDLGSGTMFSIREIVGEIVELLGTNVKPLFGSLPDRPAEPVRKADLRETYSKLRWRPKTSLKEGLRQTIDWYKKSQ